MIIGVVPAKLLGVALLLGEAALVNWSSGDRWMTAFLALSGAWFALDATCLWRERLYATWQMRLFLLGWNGIALVTMPLVWRSASLVAAEPELRRGKRATDGTDQSTDRRNAFAGS